MFRVYKCWNMKKKITNLMFSLIAVVFCCVAFIPTRVFASQTNILELSNKGVYNLFNDGLNGASGTNDFFNHKTDAQSYASYNKSNSNEIIYSSSNMCSSACECNADFVSIMKLSDNLYALAQKGIISIRAFANFCSPTESDKDNPEKITMKLYSFSNCDESNLSMDSLSEELAYADVSNTQPSYASSDYSLSLNEISGKYIALRFTSDYSKAKPGFLGAVGTSYNTMKVKNPRIEIVYKSYTVSDNMGTINGSYDYGESIPLNIPKKAGYEFNKVLVNGIESEVQGGKLKFIVEGNTNIEFLYRKILAINIVENYYYNLGNAIDLVYDLEQNVQFDYFKNGNKVESISELGEYLVKYSYIDDNYVLSGETKVFVNPIKYTDLSVNKQEFTYDGTEKTLSINNPKELKLETTIMKDGVVVSPIDSGSYTYIIKCTEYGYMAEISGEFIINPKEVYLSFENEYNKEFDGSAFEIIDEKEYEYEIIFKQDGVIVNPINVGLYTCEIKLLDKNYKTSQVFNLEITKRIVKFVANTKSQIYGDSVGGLSYSIINGIEGVEYSVSICCNVEQNIGVYDIYFENKLENTSNVEYIYENASYFVNPKKLVVIPEANQYKMFGEEDKPFLYSFSGLIDGDIISGEISREQGESAGNYLFTLGTLSNSNYNIEIKNEYYKILPQRLIIKAKNYQKVYGEEDPEKLDFEIIYPLNVSIDLSGELCREEGEDVGSYRIKLGSLQNKNYNIVFVGAKLEITPKDAFVFINNSTKYYSDEDNLTYTCEGLINGDTLSGNLSRVRGENIGKYELNYGSLYNKNYNLIFETNLKKYLTIQPKKVTITATNIEKVYGDPDKELLFASSIEIDKTQIEGKLSRVKGENVGSYAIEMGSLSSLNYSIEFVPGAFKINPREIVVSTQNYSKKYGEEDPFIDYKLYGIVKNDQVEVEILREQGENVGKYNFQIGAISNENYIAKFDNEYCLSIEKIEPIVFLNDVEVYYNGEAFEYEYNGLDLDFKFTINEKEEEPINAGEYEFYAEFIGDENFLPTISNTAKLTIKKLILPVTVTYTSFIYDGNVHEPIYICEDSSVELNIVFGDSDPSTIGTHAFKLIPSNENYEDIEGEITIIEEVQTAIVNGVSMQIIEGNISSDAKDKINISVSNINNNIAGFKLPISNKKVIKAFKTDYNNTVQASKFMLQIDAENLNGSEIQIFAIDANNNLIEVQYEIIDGKMVFETNNANLTYIITEFAQNSLSIYQIFIIIAVIAFSIYIYFITRKFNKKVKQKR